MKFLQIFIFLFCFFINLVYTIVYLEYDVASYSIQLKWYVQGVDQFNLDINSYNTKNNFSQKTLFKDINTNFFPLYTINDDSHSFLTLYNYISCLPYILTDLSSHFTSIESPIIPSSIYSNYLIYFVINKSSTLETKNFLLPQHFIFNSSEWERDLSTPPNYVNYTQNDKNIFDSKNIDYICPSNQANIKFPYFFEIIYQHSDILNNGSRSHFAQSHNLPKINLSVVLKDQDLFILNEFSLKTHLSFLVEIWNLDTNQHLFYDLLDATDVNGQSNKNLNATYIVQSSVLLNPNPGQLYAIRVKPCWRHVCLHRTIEPLENINDKNVTLFKPQFFGFENPENSTNIPSQKINIVRMRNDLINATTLKWADADDNLENGGQQETTYIFRTKPLPPVISQVSISNHDHTLTVDWKEPALDNSFDAYRISIPHQNPFIVHKSMKAYELDINTLAHIFIRPYSEIATRIDLKEEPLNMSLNDKNSFSPQKFVSQKFVIQSVSGWWNQTLPVFSDAVTFLDFNQMFSNLSALSWLFNNLTNLEFNSANQSTLILQTINNDKNKNIDIKNPLMINESNNMVSDNNNLDDYFAQIYSAHDNVMEDISIDWKQKNQTLKTNFSDKKIEIIIVNVSQNAFTIDWTLTLKYISPYTSALFYFLNVSTPLQTIENRFFKNREISYTLSDLSPCTQYYVQLDVFENVSLTQTHNLFIWTKPTQIMDMKLSQLSTESLRIMQLNWTIPRDTCQFTTHYMILIWQKGHLVWNTTTDGNFENLNKISPKIDSFTLEHKSIILDFNHGNLLALKEPIKIYKPNLPYACTYSLSIERIINAEKTGKNGAFQDKTIHLDIKKPENFNYSNRNVIDFVLEPDTPIMNNFYPFQKYKYQFNLAQPLDECICDRKNIPRNSNTYNTEKLVLEMNCNISKPKQRRHGVLTEKMSHINVKKHYFHKIIPIPLSQSLNDTCPENKKNLENFTKFYSTNRNITFEVDIQYTGYLYNCSFITSFIVESHHTTNKNASEQNSKKEKETKYFSKVLTVPPFITAPMPVNRLSFQTIKEANILNPLEIENQSNSPVLIDSNNKNENYYYAITLCPLNISNVSKDKINGYECFNTLNEIFHQNFENLYKNSISIFPTKSIIRGHNLYDSNNVNGLFVGQILSICPTNDNSNFTIANNFDFINSVKHCLFHNISEKYTKNPNYETITTVGFLTWHNDIKTNFTNSENTNLSSNHLLVTTNFKENYRHPSYSFRIYENYIETFVITLSPVLSNFYDNSSFLTNLLNVLNNRIYMVSTSDNKTNPIKLEIPNLIYGMKYKASVYAFTSGHSNALSETPSIYISLEPKCSSSRSTMNVFNVKTDNFRLNVSIAILGWFQNIVLEITPHIIPMVYSDINYHGISYNGKNISSTIRLKFSIEKTVENKNWTFSLTDKLIGGDDHFLEPGNIYNVKAMLESNGKISEEICTSLDNIPMKPMSVNANEVSITPFETAFIVRWKTPDVGFFEYFTLYLTPIVDNSTNDPKMTKTSMYTVYSTKDYQITKKLTYNKFTSLPRETLEIRMKNLNAFTFYGLEIITVSRNGAMSKSLYLKAKTLDTTPGYVRNFHAINIRPNFVSLGWEPPDPIGGLLVGYKIQCINLQTNSIEYRFVGPHQPYISISDDNLKPGILYGFNIQAQTRRGLGPTLPSDLYIQPPIWAPPKPLDSKSPIILSNCPSLFFPQNATFSYSDGNSVKNTSINIKNLRNSVDMKISENLRITTNFNRDTTNEMIDKFCGYYQKFLLFNNSNISPLSIPYVHLNKVVPNIFSTIYGPINTVQYIATLTLYTNNFALFDKNFINKSGNNKTFYKTNYEKTDNLKSWMDSLIEIMKFGRKLAIKFVKNFNLNFNSSDTLINHIYPIFETSYVFKIDNINSPMNNKDDINSSLRKIKRSPSDLNDSTDISKWKIDYIGGNDNQILSLLFLNSSINGSSFQGDTHNFYNGPLLHLPLFWLAFMEIIKFPSDRDHNETPQFIKTLFKSFKISYSVKLRAYPVRLQSKSKFKFYNNLTAKNLNSFISDSFNVEKNYTETPLTNLSSTGPRISLQDYLDIWSTLDKSNNTLKLSPKTLLTLFRHLNSYASLNSSRLKLPIEKTDSLLFQKNWLIDPFLRSNYSGDQIPNKINISENSLLNNMTLSEHQNFKSFNLKDYSTTQEYGSQKTQLFNVLLGLLICSIITIVGIVFFLYKNNVVGTENSLGNNFTTNNHKLFVTLKFNPTSILGLKSSDFIQKFTTGFEKRRSTHGNYMNNADKINKESQNAPHLNSSNLNRMQSFSNLDNIDKTTNILGGNTIKGLLTFNTMNVKKNVTSNNVTNKIEPIQFDSDKNDHPNTFGQVSRSLQVLDTKNKKRYNPKTSLSRLFKLTKVGNKSNTKRISCNNTNNSGVRNSESLNELSVIKTAYVNSTINPQNFISQQSLNGPPHFLANNNSLYQNPFYKTANENSNNTLCSSNLNNMKCQNSIIGKKPICLVAPISPRMIDEKSAIPLITFPAVCKALSADGEIGYSEEFDELKNVGKGQTYNAANLSINLCKNRFTNILPYDHSRVKLLPLIQNGFENIISANVKFNNNNNGNEIGQISDYINANYIPGLKSKQEYIATQGPLQKTVCDFWRMIWEQNCRVIVMLTRFNELGKDKCIKYWPDSYQNVNKSICQNNLLNGNNCSTQYGDITVNVLEEKSFEDWYQTDLKLVLGTQSRQIKHFHYRAWPDFGVPTDPNSILDFLVHFRSIVPYGRRPLVIHCSAGVGRTGAFICIDRIMQQLQNVKLSLLDNTVKSSSSLIRVSSVDDLLVEKPNFNNHNYCNNSQNLTSNTLLYGKKNSQNSILQYRSSENMLLSNTQQSFTLINGLSVDYLSKISIDIFGTVKEMRLFRYGMVQNEQQYAFIYQCILRYLEREGFFTNSISNNPQNLTDTYNTESIEASKTNFIPKNQSLNIRNSASEIISLI